ncbi:glycoside hydrolase [Geobacter sp. SVR]|nr:glycoside hydrolase [Geobacter sp. SVR]GCF85271.1 glycoside hydrolase [Geobacter sp. SVR]
MLAPTPYFSDRGCHVRIYEEARALKKLGHEVCIVTYHLGRDMPDIPVFRIPPVPWYKKLEAGPSWHKPYLDLLLLQKARSVARSFRPDLIHAHLHEGAFVGSILKRMLRIPLLFDYQGSLTGEVLNHAFFRQGSKRHRLFTFLEGAINRSADAIITSSGEGTNELVSGWGMASGSVDTLMDGVDTEEFRPYPRAEARRYLGIPDGVPLVVYLGLFNRYQGVDLLLEAIPLVRAGMADARFLLMGFPDEEYRRKAARMGIDDCIIFTGRVPYDRAPLMLSAGDLAVSPKLARTEANGKLFNYMACGLPVVAFESEINREILGEDAVYAEYGSASALAACIVSVLKDRGLCTELGRRARERAVGTHSWDVRALQLVASYRKLLSLKA